jgi:hypothetical protein
MDYSVQSAANLSVADVWLWRKEMVIWRLLVVVFVLLGASCAHDASHPKRYYADVRASNAPCVLWAGTPG